MTRPNAEPPKRAVIYARYSSDLQKATSITDQLALCRTYAASKGYDVVDEYKDSAKSGASMTARDGLLALMKAAEAAGKDKTFDVVVAEATDRISRSQSELPYIYEVLGFHEIEIDTHIDGIASPMSVGVRSMSNSMMLSSMRAQVRRTQAGRVREGKIPGRAAYGYRGIRDRPGEKEIDPDTAEVVRRIFRGYAQGQSPTAIARTLNAEGIPAPRGGRWTANTFTGGCGHRRGLIENRLYIGEHHWAKMVTVKEPAANKVVRRRNKEPLPVVAVPHLRIIDDALWNAAHATRDARRRYGGSGDRGIGRAIPRHDGLLSGALRCGVCGGDMRLGAGGRRDGGKRRIRCAASMPGRDECAHTKSYDLQTVERLTVEYVAHLFSDPDKVRRYVASYVAEHAAVQKRARADSGQAAKKLAQVTGAIDRLLLALERDTMPVDVITERLQKLQAERVVLEQQQALAEADITTVVAHPATISKWHKDLALLAARLGDPAVTPEARPALRALLDHVVVHPTPKRAPYRVEAVARRSALIGGGTDLSFNGGIAVSK